MSDFVWYSEIVLAYLLSSLIVAMIVGRILRHSSQVDFGSLDLRTTDRAIGPRLVANRKEARDVALLR
jgi:hypothetical protein